ncbi:unnamed protein product [Adineta steineri]|uniref:Uncharacterized protein n=1 Tax=Adineta steineri TaxID=433720 RepID=A0A819SR73_9BILA|nr:unnamed protein product [Adineta steineri]
MYQQTILALSTSQHYWLLLQQAMGAPKDCIDVTSISSAEATDAKGRRRRRDIQCDKTDRSGPAIAFDIVLDYPKTLPCTKLTCQVSLLTYVHGQFNNVSNVNITADDGSNVPVVLCRVESHPDGNTSNTSSSSGIVVGEQTVSFITYLEVRMHPYPN